MKTHTPFFFDVRHSHAGTGEGLTPVHHVAIVGPHLPDHSRMGVFSAALCEALEVEQPGLTCSGVALNDRRHSVLYPDRVRYAIRRQNAPAYRGAAAFINASSADVVCLQHGSGIYGGVGGGMLLDFLDELKKPLVTAFHCVEPDPAPHEHRVMEALFKKSARMVAMTMTCRDVLRASYSVPLRAIDVIPQGIVEQQVPHPCVAKEEVGLGGRKVLLTCGRMDPGKGVEHVLRALPSVIHKHPDVMYVILGATDPHVLEMEGEACRRHLEKLVEDLDLGGHVAFVDKFVSDDELYSYIGAADICLTPYDMEGRACSGNLSRMIGMGRVVISTPYGHAREMLAEGRGVLVRFASPMAISSAILQVLGDDVQAARMRQRSHDFGLQMTWPKVARAYMELFRAAVNAPVQRGRDFPAPVLMRQSA